MQEVKLVFDNLPNINIDIIRKNITIKGDERLVNKFYEIIGKVFSNHGKLIIKDSCIHLKEMGNICQQIETIEETKENVIYDKTADELFKELGYELDKYKTHLNKRFTTINKRIIAVYKNKETEEIIEINFIYKEYEKRDYNFIKVDTDGFPEYTNEEEIKAIMKKIEEHKNDKMIGEIKQ